MRKVKLFVAALLVMMSLMASGATALAETSDAGAADDVGILGSSMCNVGISGDCSTQAVQALGGNMVLNLATGSFSCPYRVRDIVNGQVVREGTFVYAWRPVISGVYSWYRVELRGCQIGSWAYIES